MHRVSIAALVAALLLISSGSAVAGDPSEAHTRWRRHLAEQTRQAQPQGTAVPQGQDCLSDGRGDVIEFNAFEPADEPRADIVGFCVRYEQDVELTVELDQASDPAAWEELTGAMWTLDTDTDEELEFTVSFLADLTVDITRDADGARECVENGEVDGAVLSVRFDPGCIDTPRSIESDATFFFQVGDTEDENSQLFIDSTEYSEPVRAPGDTGTGALAERLAGPDRLATAVAVSQHQFPDGANVAYLVRADAFADALAAGALTGGPILLVPACGTLPEVVRAEIARLAPESVIAVGGQAAVCSSMLQQAAAASG